MGFHKDGSFDLDDSELIDKPTPAEKARIAAEDSPAQQALNKKMAEDLRAGRGVFSGKKKK